MSNEEFFMKVLYKLFLDAILYKLFLREAKSFHLVRRMIAADGLCE